MFGIINSLSFGVRDSEVTALDHLGRIGGSGGRGSGPVIPAE